MIALPTTPPGRLEVDHVGVCHMNVLSVLLRVWAQLSERGDRVNEFEVAVHNGSIGTYGPNLKNFGPSW